MTEKYNIKNTKKLTTLDRMPQVGEVFGIDADRLTFFTCVDEDGINIANDRSRNPNFSKRIEYKKYHDLGFIKKLKNKYLVLKYLGNGLCQECYTFKYIHILFSSHEPIEENKTLFLMNNSAKGPKEFMESYKEISEYPLLCVVNGTTLNYAYVIDDRFKLKFADSVGDEDGIANELNRMESYAKSYLECQLKEMAYADYPYACAENIIYDLKKAHEKQKKYQA